MADDKILPPLNLSNEQQREYAHDPSDNHAHLKTYTAGEDGGRLAEMAKQFGLQHQRQPRKQVRDDKRRRRQIHNSMGSFVTSAGKRLVRLAIQDKHVEVARMRAVYSLYPRRPTSFSEYHTEHDALLPSSGRYHHHHRRGSSMPQWLEDIEKQEEALHAHAGGVGGDLTSAVLGIVKGMVGPAILYLPHGLANAGYAIALPMLVVTTSMFLYASQCLLDSWKLEHDKMKQLMNNDNHTTSNPTTNENDIDHDNGESITEGDDEQYDDKHNAAPENVDYKMIFLSYPELAYRALGETGEKAVKLGIGLMQSGVCLTYLIFVPQNLSTAISRLTGVYVSPEWLLLAMVAMQIPLSWIRDIRKLTVTNALANALILYGLVTCLVLAIRQAINSSSEAATAGELHLLQVLGDRVYHLVPFAKDWFLFIGTSVLLFEGSITLLVPLQEAVVTEEDRKAFPRVYNRTILSIMCFYVFFSMTCWVSLGNDVRTVLTTSLPPGGPATSVQLAYSIAVIFTFPLQNFPALEITCRSITTTIESFSSCPSAPEYNFWTQRNVISSALVGLLAVVAVTTMNSLDKVVSLMGGLLGCPIAFVVPTMVHYKLASADGILTPARKFASFFVAGMGLVATLIATLTTIMTWKD